MAEYFIIVPKKFTKEEWRSWRKTANGAWYSLVTETKKKHRFSIEMTKEQFVKWFNGRKKICYYCGVNEDELIKMRSIRSFRLTIDRKDNRLPYRISNIVLCCFRCNMIKGFTFSVKEMKEIAKKYLINRF